MRQWLPFCPRSGLRLVGSAPLVLPAVRTCASGHAPVWKAEDMTAMLQAAYLLAFSCHRRQV